MPQMHRVTTRPPPGIQEERLALFIAIQDAVEVAMREEHAPAEEDMRAVARKPLEPLEQLRLDPPRPELHDQLFVVDGLLLAVLRHAALDVPGRDDLLVRCCRGSAVGLLLGVWGDGRGRFSWLGGHGGRGIRC